MISAETWSINFQRGKPFVVECNDDFLVDDFLLLELLFPTDNVLKVVS